MNKARQSHFNAEIIDGKFRGSCGGTYDDLALCVEQGVESLICKHPDIRRNFKRAFGHVMLDTGIFAGVVDYWRGHVLTSIFGAACIYGALRGVGAVLHWMGIV